MNNETRTHKGKTYIRIDKVHARHLFNTGERLVLVPSKFSPFNIWGLQAETERNEFEYSDFDTLVNEFEYYNCDSETGKYAAFWICKEDDDRTEPPKQEVDWSKVPTGTLVRVRDREYFDWTLRRFKCIDETRDDKKYGVFRNRRTRTGKTDAFYWRYCELVEVED